jgi:nuclear transcription factor Y alpha
MDYAQHYQATSQYPPTQHQPQQTHASPVLQTQQQPQHYQQHQQPGQMAQSQMLGQLAYPNPATYGMGQPYGVVNSSHAAAMATAAASGYPASYSMAENSLQNPMAQTSPQIKTDGSGLQRPSPGSPRQQNPMQQIPGSLAGQMNMPPAQAMSNNIPAQMQQQAQRRMSHTVPSPALPSQQPQHAMNAPHNSLNPHSKLISRLKPLPLPALLRSRRCTSTPSNSIAFSNAEWLDRSWRRHCVSLARVASHTFMNLGTTMLCVGHAVQVEDS